MINNNVWKQKDSVSSVRSDIRIMQKDIDGLKTIVDGLKTDNETLLPMVEKILSNTSRR